MKSRELIDRPQKRLGFLHVATDALACDSDLNNTVWADALGLAPRPPVYRRDRDLSALSQTAEMEDDGNV